MVKGDQGTKGHELAHVDPGHPGNGKGADEDILGWAGDIGNEKGLVCHCSGC